MGCGTVEGGGRKYSIGGYGAYSYDLGSPILHPWVPSSSVEGELWAPAPSPVGSWAPALLSTESWVPIKVPIYD